VPVASETPVPITGLSRPIWHAVNGLLKEALATQAASDLLALPSSLLLHRSFFVFFFIFFFFLFFFLLFSSASVSGFHLVCSSNSLGAALYARMAGRLATGN
jgi:hypothetical protein